MAKRQPRVRLTVEKTLTPASHLEVPPEPEAKQPATAPTPVEAAFVPLMMSPAEPVAAREAEHANLSNATPAPDTTPDLEDTVSLAQPPAPRTAPPTGPRMVQGPPAPPRRSTRLRTIALTGAAALIVAAVALPRQPGAPDADDDLGAPQAQRADFAAPSSEPAPLPAAPLPTHVGANAPIALRVENAPLKKTLAPKPEKTRLAATTKASRPVATVTPVADIVVKEDAAPKPAASDAIAPTAPALVSTVAGGAVPVTITGCLEVSVDQDDFRLTDTEGADAPKSRSWRTGFLKKRAAPVALVEPPDRLALQTHVGRRVAATGLLTSHDLKLSALRVVGPTCN